MKNRLTTLWQIANLKKCITNETFNMDIWGDILLFMFFEGRKNGNKENEAQFINRVHDCYYSLDVVKGAMDRFYQQYYLKKLGF